MKYRLQGHSYGNPSSPGYIYENKYEWDSNHERLKVTGKVNLQKQITSACGDSLGQLVQRFTANGVPLNGLSLTPEQCSDTDFNADDKLDANLKMAELSKKLSEYLDYQKQISSKDTSNNKEVQEDIKKPIDSNSDIEKPSQYIESEVKNG